MVLPVVTLLLLNINVLWRSNSCQGGQAASFGKYGNPDLAPEKKHSYEAGFNAVLFNRVLNLGFTYYYALTKDATFQYPVPFLHPVSLPTICLMSVK